MTSVEYVDLSQRLDDVAHVMADWAIDLEDTDASVYLAHAVDNVTQARAALCEVEVQPAV